MVRVFNSENIRMSDFNHLNGDFYYHRNGQKEVNTIINLECDKGGF